MKRRFLKEQAGKPEEPQNFFGVGILLFGFCRVSLSYQQPMKAGIMSKVEELQAELAEAHRQAELAQDAGLDMEAYQWRQEASHLARELDSERIERPFTAYENEYGDYPI